METELDLPEDLIAAIKNNRKIEAIKILRERNGIGLREAKQLVEHYSGEIASPPSHTQHIKTESSIGGLVKAIIITAVAVAAYEILAN